MLHNKYVLSQNVYYTIKATNSDQCQGTSDPLFISRCVFDIDEISENKVKILPILFDDFVPNANVSNKDKINGVEIYNSSSQLVSKSKNGNGKVQVDTQTLSPRAYLFNIKLGFQYLFLIFFHNGGY